MTNEERQLIHECCVMIAGGGDFITYVKKELEQIGFKEIRNVYKTDPSILSHHNGIIIEHIDDGIPLTADIAAIPIILAFDFIEGAGAIVVFPDDERDFLSKQNIRVWAAEYLSGYCAFWNLGDWDWLHEALPVIRKGSISEEAKETAAHICARIAANIAVGRDVKRYPRFYLCRDLQ